MPPVPDTVALLRALLQEQAPHLVDRPLTEIPAGQDNSVVRIGHDLVARLPRHDDAVPLIANDIRWLPRAAAGLPVPRFPARPVGAPWIGRGKFLLGGGKRQPVIRYRILIIVPRGRCK